MVLSALGCKKVYVDWGGGFLREQRNQSVFKEQRALIPQPCDSAAHTAPNQPPPGTVTAPDGAEDADFSLHVLLRLCAAVPTEHALLSGEGIQQVQGGTGESEDAFTAALTCRRGSRLWRRLGV